jgi:tetratricopeptide (TPR) repeat protein
MGYGHVTDRLAEARTRLDDRFRAPIRRRWRQTLKMDTGRSSEAGWEDSPWQHTRLRRRGVLVTLTVVVVAVVAVGFLARSVVSAASNYAAGKQALAAGRYDEAARRLADAKILAILPYADSSSLYKQARQLSSRAASMVQQLQETADQASALYARANAALREGRYGDAIRLFKQVLTLDPAYADTQTQLAKAEQQQKAKQLLARARDAFGRGEWQVAAQRAERVLNMSPTYPGAKKLHQRAMLRARLKPVYDRALAQANVGHWQRARRLVKRVLADDGQYPGARKLLARIQSALAAQASSQAAPPTTAPAPTYAPPPYTPPPYTPAPPPP